MINMTWANVADDALLLLLIFGILIFVYKLRTRAGDK